MLISELNNRDDILSSIVKELNGMGIKIRNQKHKQPNVKYRNKFCRNFLNNFDYRTNDETRKSSIFLCICWNLMMGCYRTDLWPKSQNSYFRVVKGFKWS